MNDNPLWLGLILAAVLSGILSVFGCVKWYQAGVQKDVYERQNITMSQWEVFMGAKPAVKVVP